MVQAGAGAAVGLVALPRRGAPVGPAAAKGTRDHPAGIALTAVLDNAAAELNVSVAEIAVQSLEAEDWPDACLASRKRGRPARR